MGEGVGPDLVLAPDGRGTTSDDPAPAGGLVMVEKKSLEGVQQFSDGAGLGSR